jgi:hypothetical protein
MKSTDENILDKLSDIEEKLFEIDNTIHQGNWQKKTDEEESLGKLDARLVNLLFALWVIVALLVYIAYSLS